MLDRITRWRKLFVIVLILLSIPVSVYLIGDQTSFVNRAYFSLKGNKANITVNLTDSYRFIPHWQALAQGGEENDGMLLEVADQLTQLSPAYIRLDHIYDFYQPVSRSDDGKLVYDWTMLDKELDAVSAVGAKPFLSLSYMPSAISSGTEVDTPISWDEWKQVVQATIEHVSGRQGRAIFGVYYEVWNEPDLFGNFRLRGNKNYLTLYHYAALGAIEARDVFPFKIGGPATTELYPNWFHDFLDYTTENQLPVDFYSWHRYSRYVGDYEQDIAQAKEWVLEHPEVSNNLEFIITEAGFTPEVDKGYDSKYSAVQTLAMYTATFQKIPYIFSFEAKDGPGPQKYWGRWGLLTHERFGTPEKKPRYLAFEFLNEMQGYWYPVYGQGTWVKAMATRLNGVQRIMLVNYDPFGVHTENVPLHLINLEEGDYLLRQIEFLGATQEDEIFISGNSFEYSLLMRPNSALILEFVKI